MIGDVYADNERLSLSRENRFRSQLFQRAEVKWYILEGED